MSIAFKRKRKGKTDYGKRLRLIASHKPRFVVRKTNKNLIAQIIEFHPEGDKVLVSAHTNELKKFGWISSKSNIPAAYLAGLLAGVKAKKSKIKDAVLDIGLYTPVKGSVIFAALKGAVDAGLSIPHSEDVFPSEERVSGKHIVSNEKTKFTKYDPKAITKNFHEVKDKILKGA